MHVALRVSLHAALRPVVCGIDNTRRRAARDLARPHAPRQPLGFLPLQFLQHLLDGDSIEHFLGSSGQYSKDREGAVLLVLLKAPTQVLFCNPLLAHALPGLAELAQRILAGEVCGTEDSRANGKVGAVAPQPAARGL